MAGTRPVMTIRELDGVRPTRDIPSLDNWPTPRRTDHGRPGAGSPRLPFCRSLSQVAFASTAFAFAFAFAFAYAYAYAVPFRLSVRTASLPA